MKNLPAEEGTKETRKDRKGTTLLGAGGGGRTFALLADWVRHVQTFSELEANKSKQDLQCGQTYTVQSQSFTSMRPVPGKKSILGQ